MRMIKLTDIENMQGNDRLKADIMQALKMGKLKTVEAIQKGE